MHCDEQTNGGLPLCFRRANKELGRQGGGVDSTEAKTKRRRHTTHTFDVSVDTHENNIRRFVWNGSWSVRRGTVTVPAVAPPPSQNLPTPQPPKPSEHLSEAQLQQHPSELALAS